MSSLAVVCRRFVRWSPASLGGVVLIWSIRRFSARAMRGAWGWSIVTVMLVGV